MTTLRASRIGGLAAALILVLAGHVAAKKPPQKTRRPIHARSAIVAPRPRARDLVAPPPAPSGQNTAPAAGEAERTLQRQLDAILGSKWLKSAVNGVYVVDAVTGQELYSYAADRQLNPASNTKLISTATAFEFLGPDF